MGNVQAGRACGTVISVIRDNQASQVHLIAGHCPGQRHKSNAYRSDGLPCIHAQIQCHSLPAFRLQAGTFNRQINLLYIFSLFQRQHCVHAGIFIIIGLVVSQADGASLCNFQFCLIQVHYLAACEIAVNDQG